MLLFFFLCMKTFFCSLHCPLVGPEASISVPAPGTHCYSICRLCCIYDQQFCSYNLSWQKKGMCAYSLWKQFLDFFFLNLHLGNLFIFSVLPCKYLAMTIPLDTCQYLQTQGVCIVFCILIL